MLTSAEKRSLARVEKKLNMPKWKFILVHGLAFGLSLAIVTSAIDVLTGQLTVEQLFRRRLWINLAIVPVTGFLFAKILHWQLVKKYLDLKQRDSSA